MVPSMPAVPAWITSWFATWNNSLGQLWTSMQAFRTWGVTAIGNLWGVTVQSTGNQVIAWVIQWIPVPIRFGILLMATIFIVSALEQFIAWATLWKYHPSFINATGKKIAGWWTH